MYFRKISLFPCSAWQNPDLGEWHLSSKAAGLHFQRKDSSALPISHTNTHTIKLVLRLTVLAFLPKLARTSPGQGCAVLTSPPPTRDNVGDALQFYFPILRPFRPQINRQDCLFKILSLFTWTQWKLINGIHILHKKKKIKLVKKTVYR